MGYADEPSPFLSVREAAEAIADAFIGENIGGPSAVPWRKKHIPLIEEALKKDMFLGEGKLPNHYEVDALNGSVPEDGSDPETNPVSEKDYGVPETVAAKFPNVDKLIASQF